ncbi:MAG: hypothetical protein LBT31_01395 [Synergistaceae bacterium]|jgi:hypothetical protein|nr:hypothetical protein [Synergistaceae bacterium]
MKQNSSAKKIFITLFTVTAISFAGSAFARGEWDHGWGGTGDLAPRGERSFDERGCGIEITPEIQEKRTEAKRISSELRAELEKNPVDREKALDLYRKSAALRNEIGEWFFIQRLDKISNNAGLN